MASDIDKEEEALRAGMVERCELTLQSRLEPPTLTKDTSIGMYDIFPVKMKYYTSSTSLPDKQY